MTSSSLQVGAETEHIDVTAIEHFLHERGVPHEGALQVERIGDGLSNLTYRVRGSAYDMVLRRPPLPPFNPGAHDVIREAKYIAAAGRAGLPVPRVIATEPSGQVIGVPFVLTEFVEGTIFTSSLPEGQFPPTFGTTLIRELVVSLSKLHTLEWRKLGLGDATRASLFLKRHVERTETLSRSSSTRSLSHLDELTRWVRRHVPEQQPPAVMHGDYRLGNVMFDRSSEPNLVAILDWENSGVGDPLLDVAYLINTYPEKGESLGLLTGMSAITANDGFPTRSEIIGLYEESRGVNIAEILPWYRVASLWHTAIGLESLYARVIDGRQHHNDLTRLESEVPRLIDSAVAILDGQE